jgi:hypothetical protein
MKYKIGDKVSCQTETKANGSKKLLIGDPSQGSKVGKGTFLIVAKDEAFQTYKIIIDDDMIGWSISSWHISNMRLDNKLLGKKFYDVQEELIIE